MRVSSWHLAAGVGAGALLLLPLPSLVRPLSSGLLASSALLTCGEADVELVAHSDMPPLPTSTGLGVRLDGVGLRVRV